MEFGARWYINEFYSVSDGRGKMKAPQAPENGSKACNYCGKIVDPCPPPCSMVECSLAGHIDTDCPSEEAKKRRARNKERRKKRRANEAKDRKENWQKVSVYLPKTAVKILNEAKKRGLIESSQNEIKKAVDQAINNIKKRWAQQKQQP